MVFNILLIILMSLLSILILIFHILNVYENIYKKFDNETDKKDQK